VLAGAVRDGRVAAGIAGATEQLPDLPGVHPAASEGACCFILERGPDARVRGVRPAAEVVGGFSRFLPGGELSRLDVSGAADGWAVVVGRPLARLLAGHTGRLPVAVVPGPLPAAAVSGFCARVGAEVGVEVVAAAYPGADGRHFTVSPLLAAAGLVGGHGGGLVVGVSGHGHVAALYLRSPHPPPGGHGN
jgi:3-oxoacyl-[acyl-carrier-protein] synthase II